MTDPQPGIWERSEHLLSSKIASRSPPPCALRAAAWPGCRGAGRQGYGRVYSCPVAAGWHSVTSRRTPECCHAAWVCSGFAGAVGVRSTSLYAQQANRECYVAALGCKSRLTCVQVASLMLSATRACNHARLRHKINRKSIDTRCLRHHAHSLQRFPNPGLEFEVLADLAEADILVALRAAPLGYGLVAREAVARTHTIDLPIESTLTICDRASPFFDDYLERWQQAHGELPEKLLEFITGAARAQSTASLPSSWSERVKMPYCATAVTCRNLTSPQPPSQSLPPRACLPAHTVPHIPLPMHASPSMTPCPPSQCRAHPHDALPTLTTHRSPPHFLAYPHNAAPTLAHTSSPTTTAASQTKFTWSPDCLHTVMASIPPPRSSSTTRHHSQPSIQSPHDGIARAQQRRIPAPPPIDLCACAVLVVA
jgi:hypothetical protein